MIDDKEIGKRIQFTRKIKGYSQDELAELLKIGEKHQK